MKMEGLEEGQESLWWFLSFQNHLIALMVGKGTSKRFPQGPLIPLTCETQTDKTSKF